MAKKPKPPKFLTTLELAERWGLTKDHLEVRRMNGEGPPWVKLGDDPRSPVRYPLDGVLEYERTHTRTSTKAEPTQPTT